jgi:predicted Zn-dependent protease
VNRRELLGGLGVATASTALWALGCSGQQRVPTPDIQADRDEVRTWLRDAVSLLSTTFTSVHGLAVERRRTVAAADVFGTGIARESRDGVVFTFKDKSGAWQEYALSDLSRNGIRAAVRSLIGSAARPKKLDFGRTPPRPPVPKLIGESELRVRVEAIDRKQVQSRLVYNVALIDIEDTIVWSIAEGRDREHRAQRVMQRLLRAAWNGTRPVLGKVDRGWIGEVREPARQLDDTDAQRATEHALELVTPQAFPDGKHLVLLDPSVTASLLDAGTRALLTSSAATRRPEVKRGVVVGSVVAAPAITLIDDPLVRGAYGGFEYDDGGEPAARVTLIDKGRLAGTLGRGRSRRPGHMGPIEPSPSHLRLVPGDKPHTSWADDGFLLEDGGGAIVDPASRRVVITAARAREIKAGRPTGRVFADVELVGDLGTLLGAVTDVSANTASFATRDERDGEPRWRSVEAPWLRVPLENAGVVRGRRRLG